MLLTYTPQGTALFYFKSYVKGFLEKKKKKNILKIN